MKKLIALVSVLAVSSAAVAQGGFAPKHDGKQGRGGFYDGSTVVKTAKEALNSADKTPVTIEGHIIKQIDDDEFVFRDIAGTEVQIDVSKRAWRGQTIQPTDKITIQGYVDKEWNRTEIDVKNISK
ncbi:YgiW/YdeI family stress tolerance OB fold protein [Pasteurella oralis]|uniref:YgiW/YdeI family stress tolerance OB fold protein n=1 Tax=Pasteurella oralis TaxID=1071947 RepID=A0ABW4NTF8_9PAST|nr:NirD/YgiW/YdeI family stress tolerance protein [Pasteurella oralis]MDO5055390.1 NirD/YgiW/YdeI family stress tolerance protein [Pasteurella oralis]